MTAFPSYSTGTVAIGTSAIVIVGTGTSWSGVNVRPGDDIVVAGHIVNVVDVTDTTHLVIDAWPYTAVTAGAAYKVYQNSPLRFLGGQAMVDVSNLVGALNTSGFFFFVPVGATVPDPSYGNDGQYAYQPSTGNYWLKTGGVWVAASSPVSGYGGTSATSTLIAIGSNAFTTQAGLAYNGARVRATSQANHANYLEGLATYSGTTLTIVADLIGGSGTFTDWYFAIAGNFTPGYGGSSTTSFAIATGSKTFTGVSTSLAYQVGNYVRASSAAGGINFMEGPITAYSGGSLIINVTKIGGSGTHTDWNLAVSGAPGTGDLLSTNNLSDVANESTALTNLSGVSYLAQTLTSAQQVLARQNIEIAPFDALAYNNLIINGGMEIDQEHGGASSTVGSAYALDGWFVQKSGTMVCAAQQITDAPPGFSSSLKVSIGTAEASLGAGDYCLISQFVEGYRSSRLGFGAAGAQSVTVSFWTKIHRTGSYSGAIRNAAVNRSYPFSFTQNVTDTWEYKTVTINGDTAGTWIGNANGVGIIFTLAIADGSTGVGTANVWASAAYSGVTATTNGVAATSDVFQVTGVCLLPGTEAPSAARSPLIKRSFEQDLLLCRRYYYAWNYLANANEPVGVGTSYGLNSLNIPLRLPVTMRAIPTFTMSSASHFIWLSNGSNSSCSTLVTDTAGAEIFSLTFGVTMAGGAAGYVRADATTAARMFFDARL